MENHDDPSLGHDMLDGVEEAPEEFEAIVAAAKAMGVPQPLHPDGWDENGKIEDAA